MSRHNRTNDAYVGALDEQQFAQSDDEPVDSDAEPPLQRLARSHSEVSMSLYLSRQSQRDSAARASVREMFTRTPEEILERYNLFQKPCEDYRRQMKDIYIYPKGYQMTQYEEMFLQEVYRVAEEIRT